MIPSTANRVPENTSEDVNQWIREQTAERIRSCALGGPAAIERRLREIDEEWDIERTIEANAATLTVLGVLLGFSTSRKWFLLPGIVGSFLLQHALQGWCPPVPVFRRLGFRTQTEIEAERYALKALRGDFKHIEPVKEQSVETQQVVDAVNL